MERHTLVQQTTKRDWIEMANLIEFFNGEIPKSVVNKTVLD